MDLQIGNFDSGAEDYEARDVRIGKPQGECELTILMKFDFLPEIPPRV